MLVCYSKIITVLLCFFVRKGIGESDFNLPKCTDFNVYMRALEYATRYCISLGDRLEDSDIDFGLLLVKVNLELSMKLKVRKQMRKNLLNLWGNVKYLVGAESALEIYPFHEDLLVLNLPKINITHSRALQGHYPEIPSVKQQFDKTSDYIKAVLGVNDSAQVEITACFNQILESSRPPILHNGTCERINKTCIDSIRNGPNFGFALTARLAQIMFIRYTSPCHLYSEEEDDIIIKKMCTAIYSEAKYIAKRDYFYVSLLAEQIAICVQNSYVQFLNRAWIKKLLELQLPKQHCFWNPISAFTFTKNQKKKKICDLHLTGMAMSIFSYAIRYILEKCYVLE